jgi:hypothetical protein
MTTLSAAQPPDLVVALKEARIDPTLEGPALVEALQRAIAVHRGSFTWKPIHMGWVVMLHYPERRTFFAQSLEEALTWCLLWVMAARRQGDPAGRVGERSSS